MLKPAALALHGVEKDYKGLRPLRVKALEVGAGEVVSISGMDAPAAAVLTDVITGTTLPETGEVTVAGRSTRQIEGHDDWLAFLDQFGLVNDRIVLLDAMTVAQNLAVPLTLDLDPMNDAVRAAVGELAGDVGLPDAILDTALHQQRAAVRARVRLARAIALRPAILVLEHPTAGMAQEESRALADTLRGLVTARSLAVLVVTADTDFASRAATRRLSWRAADGTTSEADGWRRWFTR